MGLRIKYTDQNVFDAALDRIRAAFDRFDHVSVGFSGGKDSTVLLNLAFIVAKEKKRLPLEVYYFDEEAVHPPSVEYIWRVSKREDVAFKWYCIPVKHRNACSRRDPWWYCWNPDKKDVWVRNLPSAAITELSGFEKGMTIPEACRYLYPKEVNKIRLLGIRTQESLRRYRIVTQRETDNWMTLRPIDTAYQGYPIYDWTTDDVWVAIKQQDWDYNRTYDIFMRFGMSAHQQRVCPPFGEEPLRSLHLYRECFPELWEKMLNRVHGAATAARYANTELYSVGLKNPPPGQSWKEFLNAIIAIYPEEDQNIIRNHLNKSIRQHYNKTDNAIPEEDTHPLTGASWKFFCQIAIKGDYKNRTAGVMINKATMAAKKAGLEHWEVVKKYAKPSYKKQIHEKWKEEGKG